MRANVNAKTYSATKLIAIGLLGFACSPADRRLSLRDSVEPPAVPLSPEAARVRQLQLVRYISEDGSSWEVDADDFGEALSECGGFGACDSSLGVCTEAACLIKKHQCEGELMLAIASGTGSALKLDLDWASGTNATIPPQTAATNAALAEFAARRFRDVMAFATDTLMGVFPFPLTTTCQNLEAESEYSGNRPLQDFATAAFLDAFHEGKRAYHVAFKNTLAVSDAELSSTNSLELGRTRAISNERLSRTAAAHFMMPGVAGWLGSTTDAFCTSGRLTGPQESALSVLREAAPAPSDVLSTETDALVNGSTSMLPAFGSVRERLEEAWGVDALPATKPIWEPYGLTESDFAAAHAALKDEIQIFARSADAKLAPRFLPGGATPDFERFAGTAGQPPDRPDDYWALMSQLAAPESPVPAQLWMDWNVGYFDYFDGRAFGAGREGQPAGSLAEFVEASYSWARVITARPELSGFANTVLNPLRLLLTGEDTRGRLTHCVEPGAGSDIYHDFQVAGFDASDRLALVRGEDLMECAVNGHVEGASCELPTLLQDLSVVTENVDSQFSAIRLNYELPFQVGPYNSAAWTFFTQTNPNAPPTTVDRWYLVRPRLKGNMSPRPGDWELLLGAPIGRDPTVSGESKCHIIPIVPEAIEAAASAIAPSRDWCGTSEVSCAGTRFDERLPLEDELTGDGDDIESSWKHYLELARSAVDHADALGQEYVEASLREDLRTEDVEIRRDLQEEKANAAFQRIQAICGSSVTPENVLYLLGLDTDADLDLSEVVFAECSPDSLGPPICGVRRLIKNNPELGKIADCLGLLGDRKEMHLGDGFLCVANRGIKSCNSSAPPCVEAGMPFVYTVPNCGSCDSAVYHCLEPGEGLALFETQSLAGIPSLPDVCTGVGRLRGSPLAGEEAERARILEAVQNHPLLAPESIAGLHVRMALNYDPTSGSYVELSVGPSWSVTSKKQTELCGSSDAECPTGSGGLFCKQWNCNDAARQGDLNLRLYRAGIALMNAVPEATAEQPDRPPLRVDTVWYLNHYLQPIRAWGDRKEQGQWRLFDPAAQTQRDPSVLGDTIIPVPGNVPSPLFLWQAWNTEGPLPELRNTTGLTGQVLPGNSPLRATNMPTQLALRNAYLVNTAAKGLRLDLLDLPGSESMASATVRMEPEARAGNRTRTEFALALGVVDGRYTGANQNCTPPCDTVPDLNYQNSSVGTANNFTARDLENALATRGLRFFNPSSSSPNWQGLAPAAQRPSQGGFNTIFGEQVFPLPLADKAATEVQLDGQAELDAIELACRGADGLNKALAADCDDETPIRSFPDVKFAGRKLECLGNRMKTRAATAVYLLPEKAVEYLRNGERVYDATGGELHVAISNLRSSLLNASLSAPAIGGTLERFGSDLAALHAQLSQTQIAAEIAKVQFHANVAQQTTNCLTSVTDAVGLDGLRAAGQAAGAIVTCVNSFAQIAFDAEITRLAGASLEHESRQALAEFSGRTSDYVAAITAESIRLSKSLEDIQMNLELIEGLQSEALREMQAAAWHLSQQSSNQGAVTQAMKNLSVGAGIRYQRAFANAKKMAFLAKRSIEMRIGMPLADMVQDLPLVAAPASWEGSVCQATGINYHELQSSSFDGETFADAFLGEYVTKLEQVVESYRLVNNFHEGTDTVVVSLRDDIHNTRARCGVESRNRLYWASQMQPVVVVRPEQRPVGWTQTGCVMESAEDEEGPYERPAGNCIVTRRRSGSPFFDPIIGVQPVPAWDLEFGLPAWCGGSCAYQPGAALSQAVDLDPGRYRFSWYTNGAEGSSGTLAGRARRADGMEIPLVADPEGGPSRGFIEGLDGDWNRAFFEFDVFSEETVQVGFERPSETDFSVVAIAAPMLEKLDDPQHNWTLREPSAFSDTTDELVSHVPVCEDTTGRTFRADKWHRHCQKLCPDGYSSNCVDQARTECYWETSFHVSQRSIEAGHIFNQSGFARGNYNYRLQSLGVNFVGTNLRACDGSSLPSTCNAAGFIPYSVIHDGPYYVRNHKGQDYRAALFPGRIEHARGLGVERYISNPLGEADRTLIEPYMRRELIGRPLDGEFILRVWDEDGVNFDAIEDVQLVIDYGYWTRFN